MGFEWESIMDLVSWPNSQMAIFWDWEKQSLLLTNWKPSERQKDNNDKGGFLIPHVLILAEIRKSETQSNTFDISKCMSIEGWDSALRLTRFKKSSGQVIQDQPLKKPLWEELIWTWVVRKFTSGSSATFPIGLDRIGVWLIEQKYTRPCNEPLLWCETIKEVFHFEGNVARDVESENEFRRSGERSGPAVWNEAGGCHLALACRKAWHILLLSGCQQRRKEWRII